MTLGPLMVDVAGLGLDPADKEVLAHPMVGGVILFARNYTDPLQLETLTREIHQIKSPRLLVAVDHEGGRIQRFRSGLTELPAAGRLGELFDEDPNEALASAERCGWIMGMELRSLGIDFSFAPVLDLFDRRSRVINDRAFHADPDIVVRIATAYIAGIHRAGMCAVGKHFPGHGSVVADSHVELPVDDRSYYDIANQDLIPFRRLVHKLEGIMPAHVLYPQVDRVAAGYSPVWIQQILRQELEFQGVVFSDDLSMVGAAEAGNIIDRATAARTAGCDMLLVCNDRDAVQLLLTRWQYEPEPLSQVRLMRLHGKPHPPKHRELIAEKKWREAHQAILAITDSPSLDLGDDAPA